MASDYQRIAADNREEYGKGTRHLAFLRQLYSDRTHFVFELLQNAEDACASRVMFELRPDSLTVKHNGRAFTEADVRGICGVDEGTKAGDITKIGKFGVGFKSVLNYTATPRIYSDDHAGSREHFEIRDITQPHALPRLDIAEPWTTVLELPLNAPDMRPEDAVQKIAQRLCDLGHQTLLFLHHVQEIGFETCTGSSGFYLRQTSARAPSVAMVTMIGQLRREGHPAPEEAEETWLVFERVLPAPGAEAVSAQIAFPCETDSSQDDVVLIPLRRSPLVVFFATKVETQLGFLVQGPYKTTPARDGVREGEAWNDEVAHGTALLLREALTYLQQRGWLSVPALSGLPIDPDNFPPGSILRPLYEAALQAFQELPLLPTQDAGYASAQQVKLARGTGLSDLLTSRQLGALYGVDADLYWLTNEITDDRTPRLRRYLITELGIDEVDPEALARRLTADFLRAQDDGWLTQFYGFLGSQKALWQPAGRHSRPAGPLRSKPILRLQDGSTVVPFNSAGLPAAYLPPQSEVSVPVVSRACASDPEALEFLKRLGLDYADEVAEIVEHLLPAYQSGARAEVTAQDYQADLRAIFAAMETAPQDKRAKLIEALKATTFVRATNAATGAVELRSPTDVYLPSDDLRLYLNGNEAAWFLTSEAELDPDAPEVVRPWTSLGVSDEVRVRRRRVVAGYVHIHSTWGGHRRGVGGFDPDASVDGLDRALERPSPALSQFVWNRIALPHAVAIHGVVERATHQNYDNKTSSTQHSEFGALLANASWLPGPDGTWLPPAELALRDLPDGYTKEEMVAAKLGMKRDAVATAAKELGLPDEDALRQFADMTPEERQAALEHVSQMRRQRVELPVRESPNPELRAQRVHAQAEQSLPVQREQRSRTVSVNAEQAKEQARAYLMHQYTNDDGQMICQVCQYVLPFQLDDDSYYFEAVQLFALGHHHRENHLALCPTHAAMFQHANGSRATLLQGVVSMTDSQLPLELARQHVSAYFTAEHLVDLRDVLAVAGIRATEP